MRRWACGRIARSNPLVRGGFYKIPGRTWTTWSVVVRRTEYYIARRNARTGETP